MARGKQLQTSLWGPELRALGGRESRCQIVRHHQLVFRVWWCISLLTTSHLARLPARLAGTRCSSHWCMQIGYYILLPCQSDQSRWRGWKGVCLELPFPHGLGVIQSLLPATMCTTWIFGLPIVGGSGWSVAFPCGSVFLPRVMPAVSLRSISFGLALQWLGLRTKVSSQSWKIILAAPNTQRSGWLHQPGALVKLAIRWFWRGAHPGRFSVRLSRKKLDQWYGGNRETALHSNLTFGNHFRAKRRKLWTIREETKAF